MKLLSNKKRIFKRAAVAVLILTGFALAAFIAFRIFFPAAKIKGMLEAELSRRLNEKVTINKISIGIYPGIELAMKGVEVTDPKTLQEIVSVESVGLVLNLTRLLDREIVVEKIIVVSPDLNLAKESDGEWNLKELIEGIQGKKESRGKKSFKEDLIKGFEIEPIKVRNGTVRTRDAFGQPLNVHKIAAVVNLNDQIIHIDSASISFSPVTADLSGTVSQIDAQSPVLDIAATLRVSKEGPLAHFRAGNLPKGATMADVSLTASGPIDNIGLKTAFSFNRSATRGISTEGTLTGKLKTKEGYLDITALNAHFGGSSASLSGSCSDLWADDRTADLKGTSKIALKEVLNLTGGKLVSKIKPQGLTDATIALTASMKQISLNANFNLTNAGLVIPDLTRKEPGTHGSLLLEARFVMPNEIIVGNFVLDVGQARVNGKAAVNPGSEPWAQVTFHAPDFPLATLNELPSMRFEKGTASISAQVWQSNPTVSQVKYTGEGTVHDAALVSEYLKAPVSDLNAKAKWSDQKVSVESVSFSFAKSACHGAAVITDLAQPQIVGSFHADTLNVDEIVAAVKKKGSRKRSAPAAQSFSLKMLVEADSIYVGNLRTGSFSGNLKASAESYTFDPFDLKVFDGAIHGTSEVNSTKEGAFWNVWFDGRRLNLKKILAQLETGETSMTGLLDARGELNGEVAPTTPGVLKSLNGELRLTAKDGAVDRYGLLKTVFMFMQVPVGTALVPGLREITILNTLIDAARTGGRSLDLTSIAYTKIKGGFRLSEGVAHTDDLRFESGIADLLLSGDVNLGANTMDMKISATPLGAIGNIIGRVPFAGREIKKAKENYMSTDFIARGPIGDPKVTSATIDKLIPGGGKS